MVLAALQHNRANGGRSRGVSACALLKKDAKSNPESEPMSGDFNPEQKRYLEGFVAGLQIARAARDGGGAAGAAAAEPTGPDAAHLRAQDRVLKAGGKLSDQEKFKRELNPLDGYERLKAQAAAPKPRRRNRPAPTRRTCARRTVFSEPAASSPSRKNSSASSTRSTATSG